MLIISAAPGRSERTSLPSRSPDNDAHTLSQPGAKISLLLGKGIHHHLPEVGGNLDHPLEDGFEQLAKLVPVVVDAPAIHVAKEEKDVLLDALAIADLLVPRFPFLLAGGDFLELRGRFEPLNPLGGEAEVDP